MKERERERESESACNSSSWEKKTRVEQRADEKKKKKREVIDWTPDPIFHALFFSLSLSYPIFFSASLMGTRKQEKGREGDRKERDKKRSRKSMEMMGPWARTRQPSKTPLCFWFLNRTRREISLASTDLVRYLRLGCWPLANVGILSRGCCFD